MGDPTNGGQCISCRDYCHGHTDICVDNTTLDFDLKKLSMIEGPKENARCIRCANLTAGDRCEKCINGKFRADEPETW